MTKSPLGRKALKAAIEIIIFHMVYSTLGRGTGLDKQTFSA